MCQIAVNIPDEVLYDTKMNMEDASRFVMQAAALRYYTQRRVSLGYCAQIAGMTVEEFVKYLGANRVPVFNFDDKNEFMEEVANA